MYSYGYGGDSMNIPEICWEEAYDSILENNAGNQISWRIKPSKEYY